MELLHCLPNDLGLIIRPAYVGPSGGDCVVRQIRQVGTSHLVEGNEKNEKCPIAIFFFPGLVQIQNSGLECQDLWILKIQAIYNDAKMGQICLLFCERSHMGELAL